MTVHEVERGQASTPWYDNTWYHTQDSDTNAIDMRYHNKAYNGFTMSYLTYKAYKVLQWYYTIIVTLLTHI